MQIRQYMSVSVALIRGDRYPRYHAYSYLMVYRCHHRYDAYSFYVRISVLIRLKRFFIEGGFR